MRAIHDLATPKRKQSLVRGNCRRQRTIAPSLARSATRSLSVPRKKFIHFFAVPIANKVGWSCDRPRPPSIPCPKWTIPLPSSLSLLPLGVFSCAHVRANYFSISRVFDCSRQSAPLAVAVVVVVVVSRSTKQARHVPASSTAGRARSVAAAIIFVLIWEEKSRGRERSRPRAKEARSACDQPPRRIVYLQ